MPNWIRNIVHVSGDAVDLVALKAAPPTAFLDYDRNREGVGHVVETTPDGGLCFVFDTAWEPPLDAFDDLAAHWPTLTVRAESWDTQNPEEPLRRLTYAAGLLLADDNLPPRMIVVQRSERVPEADAGHCTCESCGTEWDGSPDAHDCGGDHGLQVVTFLSAQ